MILLCYEEYTFSLVGTLYLYCVRTYLLTVLIIYIATIRKKVRQKL